MNYLDTIAGRQPTNVPQAVVTPEGDLEYEVDRILDSRFFERLRKLQYLVSWKGYGPVANSWEPVGDLENAPDIVGLSQTFTSPILRRHETIRGVIMLQ